MIDSTATVHPTARVHQTAEIGPHAIIGERASIGAEVRIGAWATIGAGASIGPNVTITHSHELLSGVGFYPWTATASTFRYGCECHPWAEWTAAKQAELCKKHQARERLGAELRERVRQCARAFGVAIEGVTT